MSEIFSRQAEGRKASSKLSETEKEVAALICLGCRNKEIAQELDISEHTVKSHCNRIYKKLEVSDRLQLSLKLSRDPHLQDYLNRFRQQSPSGQLPPKKKI
jgi:DNA-binding NarL/FixJ family response regulator